MATNNDARLPLAPSPHASNHENILGNAVIYIQKKDMHQREKLADEIHAHQPNLLYAVLAVRSSGTSYKQLKVVVNILLACFKSMKRPGISDFAVADELKVEIPGVVFTHRLYQFALAYSGWCRVAVIDSG